MARLKDVEALYIATKRLYAERKKMERLSDRARDEPINSRASQSGKLDAALNWQAMYVSKIEAEVHAAAVDCGLADLRSAEHYEKHLNRPSAFHAYTSTPAHPRALAD